MKAKVGTCDKCGREIKVKAAGVKENMNLICKCGNKLILKPNKKAILQAEQIINSIEYQFDILSKRIDKSGLSEWEKMNKTELALFNFVQMSKFSKLEIVNICF